MDSFAYLVGGEAHGKLVAVDDGAQGGAEGPLQAAVQDGDAVGELPIALLDPPVVLEQLPRGKGLGGLELQATSRNRSVSAQSC